MRSVISEIQNEDPSYDPLALALSRARVSREEFQVAWSTVLWDGVYGPSGLDPGAPGVTASLEVLRAVRDAIDDYYELVYLGDDETGEPIERLELRCEAAVIARELFSPVIEIWGANF